MGAIQSLRFVHTAIATEARALEARALSSELDGLDEAFAWFARLSKLHTDGEEVGLFPALEERVPNSGATFLHDHDEEEALFAEILELLPRARGGDGEAVARLRRQCIALTEHLVPHIDKENGWVLPLVEEHFTPPEQGAMVGRILSTIGPEDMARAVPWIMNRISHDQRVAYATVLSNAMPPPVFEACKGWLSEGLPSDVHAALAEAVPAIR